jgi:hypothetical protein
MRLTLSLLGAGILLIVVPVMAHHSFEAEFDRTKPVTVTGKVTKFEWMNPHIWMYLDVADANGKVEKWQFEGAAPNALKRNGWNRESLKEGDTVTITGSRAKDGTNTGNANSVVLANGTRILAGTSDPKAKDKQ